MSETKELVALNADVVGYSRLLADDPDTTTRTMQEYKGLVSKVVEANGGVLIDFSGDNFMAGFEQATDAMRSAISITGDLERRNHELDDHRRVTFRMGLDKGEVVVDGSSYFGDALNVAARIQGIARPGGVSVSGRVYVALDEPELRFRPRGPQSLKNIPEPVEVHDFADFPSGSAGDTSPTRLALEAPTIAVPPIHTHYLPEEMVPLAATVRADIIHRLTRVPNLKVIDARESSEHTGGARYTIESGVAQAGDIVRIHATVMDFATLNIVKSHKWTGPADNVFEISEKLADDVAKDVEVELVVGAVAGLYADLGDPEAIENVHRGWYHLNSGTADGWAKSVEYFGKVSRSAPDLTYGHVLVGFAQWMGATYGWSDNPGRSYEFALEMADKGIELGDPTGMARMVKAAALMSQGHGKTAVELLDGLEIVRPTCDATYGLEGSIRRYMGEWDEAVHLEDKAMKLTGVNKPWYPTVKACSLYMSGRAEEAARLAEMVVEFAPTNLEALLVLAAAQQKLGLERRARATSDIIRERYSQAEINRWLDRNPYQDRSHLEDWKTTLAEAGLLTGVGD